jgi:hypothetical protein
MRAIKVGNVNVFPFRDMQELMDYTANDKKLLLSLNAEIIMKAEGEVADIINSKAGSAPRCSLCGRHIRPSDPARSKLSPPGCLPAID